MTLHGLNFKSDGSDSENEGMKVEPARPKAKQRKSVETIDENSDNNEVKLKKAQKKQRKLSGGIKDGDDSAVDKSRETFDEAKQAKLKGKIERYQKK